MTRTMSVLSWHACARGERDERIAGGWRSRSGGLRRHMVEAAGRCSRGRSVTSPRGREAALSAARDAHPTQRPRTTCPSSQGNCWRQSASACAEIAAELARGRAVRGAWVRALEQGNLGGERGEGREAPEGNLGTHLSAVSDSQRPFSSVTLRASTTDGTPPVHGQGASRQGHRLAIGRQPTAKLAHCQYRPEGAHRA